MRKTTLTWILVLSNNQKEFQQPSAYQQFNYEGEMYNIHTERGDLVVSPEHKVYAQTPSDSLNSLVLNISTLDCFLKPSSLDQMAQPNFNASANIGTSLSWISCLASCSNSLYSFGEIDDIYLLNSSIIGSICSEVNFEYLRRSGLFFLNSSILYAAVNNLIPSKSEFTIMNLTGFSLKNENNIFVSTINSIYHPASLCLFQTRSFNSLPNFKQSSSVNVEFSNNLSNLFSNKALFTFSAKNCLIDSEKFNSGNSSICCFNSGGIDKVILGILTPPSNNVYPVDNVHLFKPFAQNYNLIPITEAYELLQEGQEVTFLDENNQEIKITGITKEDYSGQIYGVDVENDIVLVRRNGLSILVPTNEPSGTKSSTVTFTGES